MMFERITETPTIAAAVGAVATPWWWPQLAAVSELAATILPILGAAWLLVKIATTLDSWWRSRGDPH